MSAHVEEVRAEVRKLECRIRNCLHGGPPTSECGTPWFQECKRLEWTPMDVVLASVIGGEDAPRLRTALIETVRFLSDKRRGFHLALANAGSGKFFAAMAVDAWADEQFLYVRKFLIKALLLHQLQSAGAQNVLQELRQPNDDRRQTRNTLFGRVQGVVQCHDQGLKGYLEFCNAGACSCIGLAQALNDNREVLLNPNADRKAVAERRKRREAERLPPVLKPGAKYWTVKKKAADFLQKGKLEHSFKLYTKARSMLEEQRDLEAPLHQLEWLTEVEKEMGKIASNLSMVSLQRGLDREALDYAEEAVRACPGWSKAHCRRALALQSLGRLDEAQLAILNAVKMCQGEISRGDTGEKQLVEYRRIRKDVAAEMEGSRSASDVRERRSLSVENPLYELPQREGGGAEVGSLGPLAPHRGIMDIVYGCLTPTDVSRMERTCRSFACDAERGRRISMGGKLRRLSERVGVAYAGGNRAEALERSLAKYVNGNGGSPHRALGAFISEVRHLFGYKEWKEYISSTKVDPMSLKTILDAALSDISAAGEQHLFGMIDFDFGLSRDFQISKFLLTRGSSTSMKRDILHGMTNLDYEEDGHRFLRRFFQHSLDIDIMKLASSIIADYGSDADHLRETALILQNNIILSEGGRRRQAMNSDDPLYSPMVAYHTLYAKHIPNDWPGMDDSVQWHAGNSVKKDSISQYWAAGNPDMFRMWKVAVLRSLTWVHGLERENSIVDYMLVSRSLQGDMLGPNHSPINNVSFGTFLVARAAAFGGAVSMSTKLATEEDLTDLFCDYYRCLGIFSAGFPALVAYSERVMAEHHALMG